MNKLSDRSIRNIELFLSMEDMDYISLSKHDMKLLYKIYKKSMLDFLKLEDENEALKETIKQLYRELNTSNVSEEEWLDYAINYNLEQLEKRIADEL